MRVVLRSTVTGLYYQGPSQWTPDQKEAHDFKWLSRVAKFAVETHLEKEETLLLFDDPQFNLVLPVSRAQSAIDS